MVSFLNTKKRAGRPPQRPHTTSISFTGQELVDLEHVIAVGQAVLKTRLPVVARLRAAMTRLGVAPADRH
jgi:hypothetical protein